MVGDFPARLTVACGRTRGDVQDALADFRVQFQGALKTEQHTIGELAVHEQIAAPSMTRIVKALVEAGWVTRTANALDARQVMIGITAEGMLALMAARSQRTAWLARRIDMLGEEDRVILARAAALLQEMSAK